MARERVTIEFNALAGRGFGRAALREITVFGKTCWRGWQPPRLRFERETDKLKTENEP